ncbi:MAG: MarR family winged helix-turn-helix transcriptional regulator [Bacillota bacterium]|jgi:DNA-binding MarR family transcriptional regulator
MDVFQDKLNNLLKDIYWNIQKVQEDFVRRVGRSDITMSEMHIIEVVGNASLPEDADGLSADRPVRGCRISDIAAALDITLPSVTVAIKKLADKQCVDKIRCKNDGRQVYVILTELGQEIYRRHQAFHQRMVKEISLQLTADEITVMTKVLENVNAFFCAKLIQETK